ncbi:MAG: sulfotransferase [Planctomycetota bacterium]
MKAVLLHDFLGWCAENNEDMLFSLAGLETKLLRGRLANIKIDRPIFVSGLARSGTTILLELLSQNEGVASYRYKDFPFIMVPYWWGKFLRMRTKVDHEAVERSHADGLKVTPESPEAMEEILWKHFFPDCHDPTARNVLDQDPRDSNFDGFYTETIRKLLLSRGASRYLAKNNYNIARLDYITGLFPDARFVVPVREPLNHIASLMKQHRLLSEEETRDKRVLAYMRRSVHFEFGLGRRPLNVTSSDTTLEIEELWERGHDVEAWAKYWRDVHTYLANLLDTNDTVAECTLVVSYEKLCGSSKETLERLYSHVGLVPDAALLAEQEERLHLPAYYVPDFSEAELEIIKAETADIHSRMMSLAGV